MAFRVIQGLLQEILDTSGIRLVDGVIEAERLAKNSKEILGI